MAIESDKWTRIENVVQELRDLFKTWSDTQTLTVGFSGHICVFLQRTNGASGEDIHRLARTLVEYGRCNACGSVPYRYPQDNNVGHGMLTFNYVAAGFCDDRLCRRSVEGRKEED